MTNPVSDWEGYRKDGPEVGLVQNPFFGGKIGADRTYLARMVNRVTSKDRTQKLVLIVERSCLLLCTPAAVVKRVMRLVHIDYVAVQEIIDNRVRTSQLFFAANEPSEPGMLINLIADPRNVLPPPGLSNAEHVIRTVNAVRKTYTGTNLPVDDRRHLQPLPFRYFARRVKKPDSYLSPREKLKIWPETSQHLASITSPSLAQASPMQLPPATQPSDPFPPQTLESTDDPIDILGKTEGGTTFGISLPDGPQKEKELDLATELERARQETEKIKLSLEAKERQNEEMEREYAMREREREREANRRAMIRSQRQSLRMQEEQATLNELETLRSEKKKAQHDLEEANVSLANVMKSAEAEKAELTMTAKEMEDRIKAKEEELEQWERRLQEKEKIVQQKEVEAAAVMVFMNRPRFSMTWKESVYSETDPEELEEQLEKARREEAQGARPKEAQDTQEMQPTVLAWSKRTQRIEANGAKEEPRERQKVTPVSPVRICPPSSVDIDVWNKATMPVLPVHRIPVPPMSKPATCTPVMSNRIPVPGGVPPSPACNEGMVGRVPSFARGVPSAESYSEGLTEEGDIREGSVDQRLRILTEGRERVVTNPLESPRQESVTRGYFPYESPLEGSESDYEVPVPKNGEQKKRGAEKTAKGKPQYWKGFMNEWSKMANSFGTDDIIHDPEAVNIFKNRIAAKPTVIGSPYTYNGLLT